MIDPLDAGASNIINFDGWLSVKHGSEAVWSPKYCTVYPDSFAIYHNEKMSDVDVIFRLDQKFSIKATNEMDKCIFQLYRESSLLLSFTSDNVDIVMECANHIQYILDGSNSLSMESFIIKKVIGKGFYGKVMLCQHVVSGKHYAIKSIRKKYLKDTNKSHRVIAERQVMMRANHPFVVQLFFAFQSPSKFYLGMEYVSGGDMFYHLEKLDKFCINDVRVYVAEIVLALSHLHSNGIVYRDLKPENVMLDHDGHIKLTDFGLSKVIDQEETSTLCGTTGYLAPELILRQSYSYEVDWWALGILTYEMLTGITPFDNSNRLKMLNDIVNTTPVFPNYIPMDAIEFISALLSKDPKLRPSIERIQKFRFFSDLEWNRVYKKEYPLEYIPSSSQYNFDSEFTNQTPFDSLCNTPVGIVPGFSYQDEYFK